GGGEGGGGRAARPLGGAGFRRRGPSGGVFEGGGGRADGPPAALPLELEEPVVVAPDAPAPELGVVVRHRPAAVEDVDPDAVLVHVGEAGLRVPGARAHLLVGDADLVVLVLLPGHGREAGDG